MRRGDRLREQWRAGLGIATLSVPALFLPLDLLYATPGILTYATAGQLATIYLFAFGLSLLAAALVGLFGLVTARGSRGAARIAVALVALAIARALAVWLASVLDLSQATRDAGDWIALFLALAAGAVFGARLSALARAQLYAALRAGFLLMTALAAVAVPAALLGGGREAPPPQPARAAVDAPPIILITVDTLSALHLPLYGYARPTAPHLAQFAAEATLFRRYYANTNFTPSAVASMLYGTRPWTHRLIQHEGRTFGQSPASSLPALLRAAGYYTAAIVTNPWAGPRNFGLEPYFSVLVEHRICTASNPHWLLGAEAEVAVKTSFLWNAAFAGVIWATDRIGICEGRHFDPELAFSQARRVLADAPADRPLFLWVHLMPPHDPYITPPPFVDAFASSAQAQDRASSIPPYLFDAYRRLDFPGVWQLRYDQAIRYVDHHIGAFLEALKAAGLYERSLIVITADHGESFSKGYGGHGGPALHEELVRIPLLIKTPGQRHARTVGAPAEQVDLAPTLLELAGIADTTKREGVSLVAAMHGRASGEPVFLMNFQQSTRLGPLDTGLVAMVDGTWKYVHYFGTISYPGMYALRDALYDVRDDPFEARNRIAAHPALAARMLRNIEARVHEHGQRLE